MNSSSSNNKPNKRLVPPLIGVYNNYSNMFNRTYMLNGFSDLILSHCKCFLQKAEVGITSSHISGKDGTFASIDDLFGNFDDKEDE